MTITQTAASIAKPLCTEFAKKYGAGWNLITPDVKAALIFDRAVLDAITYARSRNEGIDAELLAAVRLAIRVLVGT
jgi:hypothetical protein